MKIEDILNSYPIEILEQLAANKVMDIGHIRLPKDVIIEELIGVINKPSYVNKVISFRNPPNFPILDSILTFPEYKAPIKGFKDKVIEYTESLILKAKQEDWLKSKKNYSLYLKMLKTAWESDSQIDSNEAILLSALRRELNISFKEHVVLEHHEDLTQYWYKDNYYEKERNYLISAGIIFPIEENYIIPDSLGKFIRKSWGMDLSNDQYNRLLTLMTNNELSIILEINDLPISGSSAQKIQRVLENYIPTKIALWQLNLDSLKDLARKSGSIISGIKEEVIDNLIDYFDDDEDLKYKETEIKDEEIIIVETKILSEENFIRLFNLLANEQIYNIACNLRKIKKSGNKDSKIISLWQSAYNEQTLLNQLTNTELYILCEKGGLRLSGPKSEKINRLIEAAKDLNKTDIRQNTEHEKSSLELISNSTNEQIFNAQMDNAQLLQTMQLLPADEYLFLEKEELIVLSWINDLKSVNEYELDRLIARHNLSWFFPRTQMENLKDKLIRNNKDILSIRYVGDYCIYEFKK
jgi:hypothetical protein